MQLNTLAAMKSHVLYHVVCSLALVCVCAGECDTLARIKLKQHWAKAFGRMGTERNSFGKVLWRSMFALSPDSLRFFARVRGDNIHSPEFIAHSMRVLGGFDLLIALLDDQETLDYQLSYLRKQHKRLQIEAKYFEEFKTALKMTVRSTIGDYCYDERIWDECFDLLSSGIKTVPA